MSILTDVLIFGNSQDNFVMIPIASYFKTYGSRNGIRLVAKAVDQQHLMQAQDEVRVLMRSFRHLGPGQDDNFSLFASETFIDLWERLTSTIAGMAIGIVSVFMVVGGVVMERFSLVAACGLERSETRTVKPSQPLWVPCPRLCVGMGVRAVPCPRKAVGMAPCTPCHCFPTPLERSETVSVHGLIILAVTLPRARTRTITHSLLLASCRRLSFPRLDGDVASPTHPRLVPAAHLRTSRSAATLQPWLQLTLRATC
jgi:hypothetical protein